MRSAIPRGENDPSRRRLESIDLPRLLTASEVAQILRVSRRRVWALADQGLLRPYHVGASLRYSVADVARMLEESRDEAGR